MAKAIVRWHWRYLALLWVVWWAWTQGLGFSTPLSGWFKLGIIMAVVWFGLGLVKRWAEGRALAKADPKVARGVELCTSEHLRRILELAARGLRRTDERGATTPEWRKAENDLRRDPARFHDPHVFDGWVRLAQTPIPPSNEPLHFAITASTGAGKSVALRGLLADIRARGDRAIVIDNGGEFSGDYGAPGDLVLSPFDARSVGWNLVNEVREPHDWMRLARSVVPDGHGSERAWHEMAQKLLANLGMNSHTSNAELLRIATGYNAEALRPLLDGTSSSILTQDGGDRLLTNIRSVFGTVLQCWQFMRPGAFSLREYMQGTDPRWLWVPFKESELGVSRDLIACWMDILVSAGLERAEGGQNTWIIIDELDTLGELASLIAATTKLRKRNVRVVVAFQSYSQLIETYGRERASTLLNCFSNKLVLRSVDGETAEKLAREMGERERWKASSTSDGGQSSTATTSLQREQAVMPSEIQNLPDLQGYIKLAGDYPIARCEVSLDAMKPRHGPVVYPADLPSYADADNSPQDATGDTATPLPGLPASEARRA
jgi:hypothetical protein